ncbi:hypothetical protein GCM10010462_27580 [Microbacterium dextranolyticum]|uniref:Uncharacterized protein n=1 Tax=Microbacterium dextranolyticum TaxID=36806 RepID=A0A9W6M6N6_9MICO|nr:hypothetical protein AVP41_02607 [Microbacterium sp. TNHR37B]MBZ6372996.1 hypothetical protein [Microbacterium hominis]GLJ96659.1 hypothetical protein GCM10017591_27220 [Microbacterium dextranolyticum]
MAGERVHTQGEPVWVRTRGGRAPYAMVLPGPAGAPGADGGVRGGIGGDPLHLGVGADPGRRVHAGRGV